VLPSESPGNHIQDNILEQSVVNRSWYLMVAHPDCTFLAVSGARWNQIEWREEAQLAALHFVKALWRFPIPKVAIENPVGRLSSLWRTPAQVIQPWMFGDNESKATCLWLRGLPPLVPAIVQKPAHVRESTWRHAPGPERKKNRSRTHPGIAEAMAGQWGGEASSPKGFMVATMLAANEAAAR
jgi:hypothetical protein